MDSLSISDLTAEAVARYDRSDDAVDRFFDEAWRRLAPEGAAAMSAALPYTTSGAPRERSAGAEIIGRVGESNEDPVKHDAEDLLLRLLQDESDAEVRDALAAAVGLIWHSRDDDATPRSLASHPNPNLRFAAAHSLGLTTTGAPKDAAKRAALEVLKEDADDGVRKWATFGLETLSE